MKQFFSRRISRWILFTLLLVLIVIGFIYMSGTTQLPSILPSMPDRFNTQVYACLSNRSAINITFLGSRPFCMHLLSNDIVSNVIAKSGAWMPSQTKFISLLLADSPSKPAVFLDIGANIGWFTVVMSVFGHKVIAIEPMDTNVKLIRASLLASQTSQNVIVHSHGLGVIPGKCILYSDNGNLGDGHVLCGISSVKDINALVPPGYSMRQFIESTRLDALVAQDIDVIKIDVEGSELHAVSSGDRLFDRYHVRHIISEFSPRMIRDKNSNPYEYLNFFVSRGYDIRIVNDGLTDLYQRNAWRTVPVFRSEQDLRKLSNRDGELELWFTKN